MALKKAMNPSLSDDEIIDLVLEDDAKKKKEAEEVERRAARIASSQEELDEQLFRARRLGIIDKILNRTSDIAAEPEQTKISMAEQDAKFSSFFGVSQQKRSNESKQ